MADTARAVDTETLPRGVRGPQIRFGHITGIDQTYGGDSKLYNLGETRSVPFDAQTLARVNERARSLIRALNFFGSGSLGSKINLGTLNIETKPEVSYIAPVFAYGITDRWTLGLGVPVIRYRNQMRLSASGSNLDFYRAQFLGISAELDSALTIDLPTEASKVIASKGYLPLESRSQTFIGDLNMALLHRLPDLGRWSLMHQLILNLPTGPKDSPDDLLALNSFGRSSIEKQVVAARPLGRRWTILPYGSFLYPLPDNVTKRIPKDEEDMLPDPETKRDVIRMVGPTSTLGGEVWFEVSSRWQLKAATEFSWKLADRYNGDGRMDLLAKKSDSSWQRVRAGLTYSTITAYRLKELALPARLAFEISDTVAGRNVERQLRTEITGMLFF